MCRVCVSVSLHACGKRLAPIISLVGYDPPTVGVAELKHVVNFWLHSFLFVSASAGVVAHSLRVSADL